MKCEWQPIETAPLDGTEVLIAGGTFECSNSLAGEMKSKGVSLACYDEWVKQWRGDNAGGHDEYYWHKPTHWMPLPKPPELIRRANENGTMKVGLSK